MQTTNRFFLQQNGIQMNAEMTGLAVHRLHRIRRQIDDNLLNLRFVSKHVRFSGAGGELY